MHADLKISFWVFQPKHKQRKKNHYTLGKPQTWIKERRPNRLSQKIANETDNNVGSRRKPKRKISNY